MLDPNAAEPVLAMAESRPRIALTLGDPSGIGPEIVAGAWPENELHRHCRPLVIGHPAILRKALALRGVRAEVVEVEQPDDAIALPDRVPCIPCGSPDAPAFPPGAIDARSGQAAYEAVVLAARLALDRRIDAITTAPLHKEALHAAGHDYPGHTELLAALCGVRDFAMMLYLGPEEPLRGPHGLAVVHVTLHTAMRNVFAALTPDAVLAKCRLADRFMRRMKGGLAPRIGVCALNPHGGEGGLFGDEELRVIHPAVQEGCRQGLLLEGPLPADTLMVRARDGEFDALVAMYHDQGHIAMKLLGMHRAVNVTLGLPIVRTSVAHGTAFDIAWKGVARVTSLLEAVRVAARLAGNA
jgi:4-hydroxythreonine-4-phosphate dehydrogenase